MLPPPFSSSTVCRVVPVRHRKNKLLVVLLVFVLLDCLAAHAICLNILRLHGHLRVLARVRFEHEMLLHSEMPGRFACLRRKSKILKFVIFLRGVSL